MISVTDAWKENQLDLIVTEGFVEIKFEGTNMKLGNDLSVNFFVKKNEVPTAAYAKVKSWFKKEYGKVYEDYAAKEKAEKEMKKNS